MASFSVGSVGFPENELAWLEAILTIARGTLRDDWRWVVEGPADVYLVAVESAGMWDRCQADHPTSILVACASPDLAIDARWRVDRDRGKLPGLRQITQVLNALAAETAATGIAQVAGDLAQAAWARTAAAESGPSVRPAGPEQGPIDTDSAKPNAAAVVSLPLREIDKYYDPERHLIGIVRECRADRIPRRLYCAADGSTLLIDPEKNQGTLLGDENQPGSILTAARAGIEVHSLGRAGSAVAPPAAPARVLALDDLVFLSVLLGSRGRMWAGCRIDDAVKLTQWPNLGHLPEAVDLIRVAAFMSGNTADVKTIAERTGIALDQVVDFHNACMAVDLLERGGEVVVRDKAINPSVRDLYQKIAKRLQSEV